MKDRQRVRDEKKIYIRGCEIEDFMNIVLMKRAVQQLSEQSIDSYRISYAKYLMFKRYENVNKAFVIFSKRLCIEYYKIVAMFFVENHRHLYDSKILIEPFVLR